MVQDIIRNEKSFEEFFEKKQEAIGNFAKEMAEREVELGELNLFVSASGKKHLDMASKSVKKLRKLEEEGKISLKEFENLAEDF